MRLSAIFTAAVKAEIITKTPLANVESPKLGEIDRPALTPEQARLFISRLADVRHTSVKALLITELMTGARTCELRALTWDDINLDNGFIYIRKSVDNKNRITPPKTKPAARTTKLDAILNNFLIQYKRSQDEQIKEMSSLWIDKNLVFPNLNGDYLGVSFANKTLKNIIKDTDIPQTLHAHSLRHSFASILIDSGANVKIVQDALGHSSSQVTLDIYSHSFESARAKAMEAVSIAVTGGNYISIL